MKNVGLGKKFDKTWPRHTMAMAASKLDQHNSEAWEIEVVMVIIL